MEHKFKGEEDSITVGYFYILRAYSIRPATNAQKNSAGHLIDFKRDFFLGTLGTVSL